MTCAQCPAVELGNNVRCEREAGHPGKHDGEGDGVAFIWNDREVTPVRLQPLLNGQA